LVILFSSTFGLRVSYPISSLLLTYAIKEEKGGEMAQRIETGRETVLFLLLSSIEI
jgi:hypothetical protein